MGFLNKIFGDKVKVPKFKEIDPDAEIDEAFRSIQQRMPEGKRVARSIAEADAETALAVLEQFAPGSQAAIQQQMQNIQAGLRGELPEDVQRLVTDRAAARAFAGGFGGSGAARALELRDLGLTSLQRIDTAMGQSAQAFQTIRGLMPQQQSVSSMFLMPGQRIALAQSERNARFQRDMQAAQAKAQPDPVAKGVFDAAVSIGGAALGGFMGGKGLGTALGASGASAGTGLPTEMFKGAPFLTPSQGTSAFTPLPYNVAGPYIGR
tara:strand:+ start:312 stop:1106 length:795 start_codon:yes stop_codon:yes gene_type:complete